MLDSEARARVTVPISKTLLTEPTTVRAGGEPSALEATCHLVAHDIDLFKYLLREWLVARAPWLHSPSPGYFFFKRMSEIADTCV